MEYFRGGGSTTTGWRPKTAFGFVVSCGAVPRGIRESNPRAAWAGKPKHEDIT